MTDKTDYLSVVEALALHAIGLKRYGGSSGIRDFGALESALSRPQSGYYKDIIEQAAALLESMTVNHPFVDENKRAAFAVADTFLRINGYQLIASNKEIFEKFTELFEKNAFVYHELEPWLRSIGSKIK